jgi:hypothetical protein
MLAAWRAGRALPSTNIPGTHLCQKLSKSQGYNVAESIRQIEKSSNLR